MSRGLGQRSRPGRAAVAALERLLPLGLAVMTVASASPAMSGSPDGARLYARHCVPCHGPDGRGGGPNAKLFAIAPRDLREGFLDKYSTDELVRRVREGKPLELARDLPALRRRAQEVEDIVKHLKRLSVTDEWLSLDEGWAIYAQRCEACHGPFGRPLEALPGGVRTPRDLADPAFQRSVSDAELVAAVRHGRKGMPALAPRLTEAQADALVVYLRMLSPGFESYTRYCAQCHGDDGHAPPSFDSSLPRVTFDREYFATRDPEEVRRGVWHMLDQQKPVMPHLRWTVSEEETRAIIEYLKRGTPAAPGPPATRAAPGASD